MDNVCTKCGEPFVQVKGKFTIACGHYDESQKDVKFYACPKCNTVQMKETY